MTAHRAVTFDLDWAPDWAIADCAALCREAGIPMTFFVTHQCDILDDFRKAGPTVELGIHPNFLPGSDHGLEPVAALTHCMNIVPEATSMRTHALVQSTPILTAAAEHTPITVDVSLLLPFHPGLQPTSLYLGHPPRRITRLPYLWEDDIAAAWPGWNWQIDTIPNTGLCITDFHPIHVALNSDNLDRYQALKASLGRRRLNSVTEEDVAPFRNPGIGARTFLQQILTSAPRAEFATVSALGALRADAEQVFI